MLIKFPVLPKLPIELPEEFIKNLAKQLGPIDEAAYSWIALSLLHSSYLNENHEFSALGITKETLGLLYSLGFAHAELALFHLAYQDNTLDTPGDVDHFVHQNKMSIIIEIVKQLDLLAIAHTGKGEIGNTKLAYEFGLQFLGAVRICLGSSLIFSIIKETATKKNETIGPVIEYKTVLQEYSQSLGQGLPEYTLSDEKGPDHAKLFRVRVTTHDGKREEGEGQNKALAAKVAAKHYMEKYAYAYLQKKSRRLQAPNKPCMTYSPPAIQKERIGEICQRFNASPDKCSLFIQALTLKSFVNETRTKNYIHNAKLAQLGSQVLEAIAADMIVERFFVGVPPSFLEFNAESIVPLFCKTDIVAKGFDYTRLETLLLIGKGEKGRNSILDSIKANAFQAILGAAYVAHGSWDSFILNLHQDFSDWLTNSFNQLLADNQIPFSSKGRLQENLQAMRMKWEYKVEKSGLDHSLEFTVSISLKSTITEEQCTLKSKALGCRNKHQAEEYIASLVSKAIDEINFKIGTSSSSRLLENKTWKAFASFLLRHEMAIAPQSRLDATRWFKAGMLGGQLLTNHKLHEFRLWANKVDEIMCEYSTVPPDYSKVFIYYNILWAISIISNNLKRTSYLEQISTIVSLVESLDPDHQLNDIREDKNFHKLLSFSKVFKLLSQERKSVNLSRVINDFVLLRQARSPVIQIQGDIPDILLWERIGTYHAMLNELITIIDSDANADAISIINISVSPVQVNDLTINIRLELAYPLYSIDKIRELINGNPFWKFLRDDDPITISLADINPQIFVIQCNINSPISSFGEQALQAFGEESSMTKAENEQVSQLLHDIKNQLIAYQVALDSIGSDRTSLLRGKYEASQHLDNATVLCRSLEVISNAMKMPKIEAIDIREYLRRYVAEKLIAVPPNIRIDPPKTIENCEFWTAPDFLRSILENLIKNSIEAMPEGGEIRVDWLFDQNEKTLLIEVSDTGPGIEGELLSRLLTGKVINSEKHIGSGIGLLTIRAMIERLGGTFSAHSELGRGTLWTLTLPSLTPIESINLPDEGETQTLSYPEQEIEFQ